MTINFFFSYLSFNQDLQPSSSLLISTSLGCIEGFKIKWYVERGRAGRAAGQATNLKNKNHISKYLLFVLANARQVPSPFKDFKKCAIYLPSEECKCPDLVSRLGFQVSVSCLLALTTCMQDCLPTLTKCMVVLVSPHSHRHFSSTKQDHALLMGD